MNPDANAFSSVSTSSLQNHSGNFYVFELFVCGMTRKSIRTIKNVKNVLEQELSGNYTIEVFDIFKNPQQTCQEQIMTTPTLIKKLPLPTRKISGDINSKNRVLYGLNITPQNRPKE